jgi:hypothetical protein
MREAGDWAERKRGKNEDDRRCAMKVLRKKVLAAAALSAAMLLFSIAGSAASQSGILTGMSATSRCLTNGWSVFRTIQATPTS